MSTCHSTQAGISSLWFIYFSLMQTLFPKQFHHFWFIHFSLVVLFPSPCEVGSTFLARWHSHHGRWIVLTSGWVVWSRQRRWSSWWHLGCTGGGFPLPTHKLVEGSSFWGRLSFWRKDFVMVRPHWFGWPSDSNCGLWDVASPEGSSGVLVRFGKYYIQYWHPCMQTCLAQSIET